jgi:hypothetical protein
MIATIAEFSPETMLPELLSKHPEARPVLDRYGLRGCGGKLGPVESIRFFARTHGVEERRLMVELADAIEHPKNSAPSLAARVDSIYRPYFMAGIVLILSAGATWGAYLLWQIGLSGKFTGASLHAVNAHGHAQIYGWVGLFIMGFSLQAFPRLWHTDMWRPRLAFCAYSLMVIGLILRTIGMTMAGAGYALPLALAGAGLEIASIALYSAVLLKTFLKSDVSKNWRDQPYLGFAFSSIGWFMISSVFCAWHMWNTMTASPGTELVWYVATYQAPLRDMQIHGLALCMILGVSIRMLPALFEVRDISPRRGWWALGILNVSVLSEVLLFLTYRWTGNHALAALLLLPWAGLLVAVSMIAIPWKLWRPFKVYDRCGKFIRASYAWLLVSLILLLLLPAYQAASGIPFSHAYYGAIRHSITVGCISLMIMGFAAKVVPTLNGLSTAKLSALWLPFVLVNTGCFLRVTLQTMTDWHPIFFALVGISGILEVTGLAIWGIGLASIMIKGAQEEELEQTPKPDRINSQHRITQILAWYPQTAGVFDSFGFTLLKNPVLRRTVARHVTLNQACALKNVSIERLLNELNATIAAKLRDCGTYTACATSTGKCEHH